MLPALLSLGLLGAATGQLLLGRLMCPSVKDGEVGICVEACSQGSCAMGELCCSNGCGKACTKAVVQTNNFCKGSKDQWCREMCNMEEMNCADDECIMRMDNCCTMECKKKGPEMCQFSKQQKCKKICGTAVQCGEDECLMRNDNCCDLTCEAKPKPQKMCENAKERTCFMNCPEMRCEEGECLMRSNNCCDLQCRKDDERLPEDTPYCEDSPLQACRMFCPKKTCEKGQCLMREGVCCNVSCQDIEKTDKCEWKSPMCNMDDPDACKEGYSCKEDACVPSSCSCKLIDGKPTPFECTEDCRPGCVKDDDTFVCKGGDCGFLENCEVEQGKCLRMANPTFDDMQVDCEERVNGIDQCKATGCGKKLNKKGKCIPKRAKKISCKTIKDEQLCKLVGCPKFKKGKCGGKSKMQ